MEQLIYHFWVPLSLFAVVFGAYLIWQRVGWATGKWKVPHPYHRICPACASKIRYIATVCPQCQCHLERLPTEQRVKPQ